jgi:predicted secreted protein
MTMVNDKRAKKVAFVANCILNQNAKVNGFAFFPDLIFEMVEVLHKHHFGLVQFPCPETSYAGTRRWWYVREQYDTPAFRKHCQRILVSVLDQMEAFDQAGYKLAIVGLDGSPSCGVAVSGTSQEWGGPPIISKADMDNYPTTDRPGIFMEEVFKGIEARELAIPKHIGAGFDMPGFDLKVQVDQLDQFLAAV